MYSPHFSLNYCVNVVCSWKHFVKYICISEVVSECSKEINTKCQKGSASAYYSLHVWFLFRMVMTSPHPLDSMWKRPPLYPPARLLVLSHAIDCIFLSKMLILLVIHFRSVCFWSRQLLSPLCTWQMFFFHLTMQGSCFGSDEIKALILRFLQQWVSSFYVDKQSVDQHESVFQR